MEHDPLQAAKNEAHEQAEHLGDAAKQAGQDIRDGVDDAAAAAERAAANVQSGAADLTHDAAAQAGAALAATGQTLDSLAQTVRNNAPSGAVGEYAQSTAAAIEKGADYLKQADANDVWQDAAQFVRRHPLSTLLVTLGVGYLLARAARR